MNKWKWLLMLFLVAFMLGTTAIAQDAVYVPSGNNRAVAAELNPGVLYRVKAEPDSFSLGEAGVEGGWYCILPMESGKCYIYNHIVTGDLYTISYYNSKGNKLGESPWFETNEEGVYSFDVTANEITYIRFFTISFGSSSPVVTICLPGTHVYMDSPEVVLYEPTCTEEGMKGRECKLCQVFTPEATEKIPVIEHASGEWLTNLPGTCVEAGLMEKRCTICGTMLETKVVPASGHVPSDVIITAEASCINKGIQETKCLNCGEILVSTEIPMTDHISGVLKEIIPATCTTDGYYERRCEVCNTLLASEKQPAFGHSVGEFQTVRDGGCEQTGLRERTCKICFATFEREEIPATGHSYTEWETLREATKENEGEKYRYCSYCGDIQFMSIPKVKKFLGLF